MMWWSRYSSLRMSLFVIATTEHLYISFETRGWGGVASIVLAVIFGQLAFFEWEKPRKGIRNVK